MFRGLFRRRRAAPPSLAPPNAPDDSSIPIAAPSADMQGHGEVGENIDEALRLHHRADRLTNATQIAVEVAESPIAWEAAGTTVVLFEQVISGLRTFSQIINAVSEIHPYLTAALTAINAVVKPIANQGARDEAFEKLLEEMLYTYTLIKDQFDPTILPRDQSPLLVQLFTLSKECADFINQQYAAKNFWARAAKNALRGGEVDDKLGQLRKSFSEVRERWSQAALRYIAYHPILAQLKPSSNIGHSTLKACLPGTRLDLLREISERIRITRPLFVVGVAGSGKSALAHSTAIEFERNAELGCFFQFDPSERAHGASRLIPTIAHALALRNEGYRIAVVRLLQTMPDLAATNDIIVQWRWLIQEAGKALASSGTMLLVVDAFDECLQDDCGARDQLLDLLTRRIDDLPANVRLLVTSRPTAGVGKAVGSTPVIDIGPISAHRDIRRYVRHQLPGAGSDGAGLDDSECDSLADAADNLFQWAATACLFLKQRPGGMTIHEKFIHNWDRLVRSDSGHTSLDSLYRTVLSDAFDVDCELAMSRYRSVMAMVLAVSPPLPKAGLDTMYRLATDSSGQTGQHIVGSVLDQLGVVITGTSRPDLPIRPMHTSFRDFLVNESRSDRWYVSPEDILRGHHIIALGALMHQARSLAFNMCEFPSSCIPNTGIQDLRSRLNMLPAALEYSACFWDHHVSVIVEAVANPETAAGPPIGALHAMQAPLRELLLQKFLFWLELLSLCGRVEHAVRSLLIALKVFQGDQDVDMREFLNDATVFARHFCSIMSRSAPHVYLSALPFAPESSLIRRHFLSVFPGLPVARPLLPFWPIARDRIWFKDDWVYCVLCTPDLRLIAGCKDGTVRIGNAENPHDPPSYLSMDPEPGLDKLPAACALAYSPRDHLIAVGHADGGINLWDAMTYQHRRKLDGHSRIVTCVTFTADGAWLISGSGDHTLICWNHSDGTILHKFEGHGACVTGVACSSDSLHIYSSSIDMTVRVWDIATGDQGGTPLHCGPGALSMSYSPDRRCIAVGIGGGLIVTDGGSPFVFKPCIQLWDMETSSKIGELPSNESVRHVQWSPDGRYIASASDDMTIRLWSPTELCPIGDPLHGSTGEVTGVSFSPDGQTLFSSACDCYIRVWNVASIGRAAQRQIGPVDGLSYSTDGRYIRAFYPSGLKIYWETGLGAVVPDPGDIGWRKPTVASPDGQLKVQFTRTEINLCRGPLESGATPVTLLRHDTGGFRGDLLPDTRRFVASSWANEIRVWDLDTCVELCTAFKTGGPVKYVAFSPDGTEVATGMYDSTVRIWSVENRRGSHTLYPFANFTPQETVDEHGTEYSDASLRCTTPDTYFPEEYLPSVWMPGMRLLLNAEPLSVDFSNARYGTDWEKCYSGDLPSATLEEVAD